ncbi:prenyltransferase/squalene oxidase repeat-containing protein [Ellagibacter isourolithinifaciens]|uniref:prenyltransferase/squalene oxidase repeat-containing protein n=1 Tax=Ellagibacter isourolithinifaciens TaxID=2137581 RepID=UPI003A94A632
MTTRNNTRRERAAAKRALAAVLALTLACSLSPAPSLANDGSALNFDSDASASIEGNAPISGPVEGFDSVAVEGEEHDFAPAENAALDSIPVFAPDEALASGSDGAFDPDSVPVESAPGPVDSIPAPRAGANYREVLAQTAAYLSASVPDPGVSSIGGEWAVIGLARNGSLPADWASTYYTNLVRTLRNTGGVLHRVKYTEYSRVVLALSSLGFDPTDVAGYDALSPLGDFDQVCWQGVNGPIWALIALDSRGYDAPTAPEGKRQTTRDALVDAVLDSEIAGGGWALSGSVPDVDMTAMALTSLAPYRDSRVDAAAAIDRGLAVLSSLQGEDGGYGDAGSASSESCAQVVVALSALGIDPASDARFAKAGGSVLDALCAFAVPGGGFKHVADGEVNGMATEQGFYALVAYERLLSGKMSLFDMSDVASAVPPDVPPDPDPVPDPDPIPTPDPEPTPSGQPSGGAGAQGGGAPSGKTLFAAQTAAPSGEKMVATSSLSPESASSEDAPDAGALSACDAASAPGDQPGQDSSADAAAASDNALSPWLWAGIAVVAACALAALGVYRARLARKDDQAEADQ